MKKYVKLDLNIFSAVWPPYLFYKVQGIVPNDCFLSSRKININSYVLNIKYPEYFNFIKNS